DPEALEQHDPAHAGEREREAVQLDAGRVEHRDDDDRPDVVDDRECEQEDAHAGRNALAEQGEHADRERDIGRDRNAPAVRPVAGVSPLIPRAGGKMRTPGGTRWPSRASTPIANAISVATGTPQPCGASPPAIAR